MKTTATVVTADYSTPLPSRLVVLFTGLSYLFVGFGFSFLDRRFGTLGLEGLFWLVWAVLGFGAGMVHLGRPAAAGRTQWIVLGSLGVLLVMLVGFPVYNLLRWTALTLMVVIGARAAVLKTRSDFYLSLMAIFVVSFLVGTHPHADWTLWFYLGPAWVFGGLSLAWDHAAGSTLSRWTHMLMALGFITVSLLLALALFFFAPRPPILGFGFLPPGSTTPAAFEQAAGSGGQLGQGGEGGGGGGGGGSAGAAGIAGPALAQSGWGQKWDAMLQGMRRAASDPSIPQWQRSAMESLLDWAQALSGQPSAGESSASGADLNQLLWRMLLLVLLALLLRICYLQWRRRYHLGVQLALAGAWLLARTHPAQSMRLSAWALKWCLHFQGHPRRSGQSVREHWVAATELAPLPHRWLGYAVECYCATRFGEQPASRQQAIRMRTAVLGAHDLMTGRVPALSR